MSFAVSPEDGASAGLKPWEPEALSPIHMQLLAMLAAGVRAREISQMPGMPSESRISIIRNSPAGKAFLAQMARRMAEEVVFDAKDYLQANALNAAQKVVQLLNAESENVQLAAAKDILDRSGLKPVERVMGVHAEVASEDVNRIIAALNESREPEPTLHHYEDSSGLFKKDSDMIEL